MNRPIESFAIGAVLLTTASCTAETGTGSAAPESVESRLEAPTLASVKPMSGALHVNWESAAECETVEAERKADMEGMEDWERAFTAPGSVGNKMDADATHDATYSYRLRCRAGGRVSDWSNQASARAGK